MERVVVEEEHALRARSPREGERVRERRMPPADVLLVLVVRVLAVVDQEGGVARELQPGDPIVVELV